MGEWRKRIRNVAGEDEKEREREIAGFSVSQICGHLQNST
jgi:hypothetical protein